MWILWIDRGIDGDMENISSLQETEFSGSCDENYLEIRLGTEEGRRIKKFCSGSQPTGHVHTNSGGVYVKWVKPQGDTAASFSGKWTTTAVSCCTSISLESPFNFNNANGVYNFDAASGHYKHESENIILYSHPNRLGHTGWFFAHHDMNHIEILNPVCTSVKIFNAYL